MTETESSNATEGEINQLISFLIGSERFGLDILRVKEVIRTSTITRLPMAPKSVKGIVNLRGSVIPIIDLRERFGLEQSILTDATRVIVVDIQGRSMGMIVDAASEVVRLSNSHIEPTPPVVGGLQAQFITGIGKLDEQLIMLLDVDRILAGYEMAELGLIGSQGQEDREKLASAV